MGPGRDRKSLVWLPLPEPDDPIGHALRSAFPKEELESAPSDIKALLFILKTLPARAQLRHLRPEPVAELTR